MMLSLYFAPVIFLLLAAPIPESIVHFTPLHSPIHRCFERCSTGAITFARVSISDISAFRHSRFTKCSSASRITEIANFFSSHLVR